MLNLIRTHSHRFGLKGHVALLDNILLHSLEPPLGRNPYGPIPPGLYRLVPHTGIKYRNVFALVNPELGVTHYPTITRHPNPRSAILVHAANFASQLRGCIALGLNADMERDKTLDFQKVPFLVSSKKAIELFNKEVRSLKPEERFLRITENENVSAFRSRF